METRNTIKVNSAKKAVSTIAYSGGHMSILKAVLTVFFIFVILVNTASALETYTSTVEGYQIEYPTGWSYTEETDGTIFSSKTGTAFVTVVVQPESKSFDAIKDDLGYYGSFDYDHITINSVERYEWKYYKQGYKIKQVIFLSGKTGYFITAYSLTNDFLFYSETFDQIINSFQILKHSSTAKFRVGPTVRLRPVTDVIDAEQDGIVELYMDNPSLNDVALTVVLGVDLPNGIYLYGEGWVPLKNEVYTNVYEIIIQPGTAKTITIIVKADKSAEVGQHDLQINGLYMPGENIDSSQEVTLLYPVNVKEASAEPYSPEPSVTPITDTSPVSISEIIFIIIFILLIFFVIKITTNRGKKPTPAFKPTPTRPAPAQYPTTPQKPEPEEAISKPSASVELHGEKTDVVLGEDIILKLSAVNLITKPVMTVQVILIPPSGMSVTSSEFVISGAGQYTTTYTLKPGSGKDIEVRIKTNQVGEFKVKGRIVYYYGEDKETAEDHTLTLPIKVRPDKEPKHEVKAARVPTAKLPKEEKKSIFDEEKRKQLPSLETLDSETRSYLNLGVDTALSMLDAEISKAESNAMEVQEDLKKNEEVLSRLASRLANKEISEQTYNDLKNKYTRKVSESKSKIANLEGKTAKLQKIRSFIEEKGKYYT